MAIGLILTSCTNRKKLTPSQMLTASDLPSAPCGQVLDEWIARLSRVADKVPARKLYCGRSFAEALAASEHSSAPVFIVSAGLGLVSADQFVPSYSLTVAPSSNQSVLRRFSDQSSQADWWAGLSRQSPFSRNFPDLIRTSPDGLVLLALPGSYLAMIRTDLQQLETRDLQRIRIFALGQGDRLDPSLRSTVMPYDQRLDGRDSENRGTRGDFPQRALRHFVEHVAPRMPSAPVHSHRDFIDSFLFAWRLPLSRKRARQTDSQIKSLISTHWNDASGQSSKMLRYLRDNLEVACEQSRFKRLFHEVRKEIVGEGDG